MKKHMMAFLIVVLAVPTVARAIDELMPASSEDLEQFDKVLANQNQRQNDSAPKKRDNFGQKVRAEATKMKMDGASTSKNKSDFGKWVNGQRRQKDNDSPAGPDMRSGNGGKDNNGGRGRHRGH